MNAAQYTPGHDHNATEFMARRSLESHGEFFQPYLSPGMSVLDCGCGPGTITLEIAKRVTPSRVLGIDFAASQIERATIAAAQAGIHNVAFQVADCHCLRLGGRSFDRVFCHALLEHLADPVPALCEFHRVLRPKGIVGVCSPDWGGFVIAPPSPAVSIAIDAYTTLQRRNGGDVHVGRKLGAYLASAGFHDVRMSARYECYSSLDLIGEYLAAQLEREGDLASAETWRHWSKTSGGMFAQAWIAAIGYKP